MRAFPGIGGAGMVVRVVTHGVLEKGASTKA